MLLGLKDIKATSNSSNNSSNCFKSDHFSLFEELADHALLGDHIMRKPIGRPLLRLRSGTMRPRARNLPVVDGVSMGSPAAGTFGDLRLVVGREPFDDLRAKKRQENEQKNEQEI